MFGWWADLTPLTRFLMAGSFLLASTALWFAGYFWPWGWAIGGVLLMFSFPSSAEKRGYRDF